MSADDIDDELFALAGGDEDAEVEEGEAYVLLSSLSPAFHLPSSPFVASSSSPQPFERSTPSPLLSGR